MSESKTIRSEPVPDEVGDTGDVRGGGGEG